MVKQKISIEISEYNDGGLCIEVYDNSGNLDSRNFLNSPVDRSDCETLTVYLLGKAREFVRFCRRYPNNPPTVH